MDYQITVRRLELVLINKKKRTCQLVDFAISAYSRVKMTESGKISKYLDLARELKKLWNVEVKVIPVVIGGVRMIPKSLEKRIMKILYRGKKQQ